MPRGVYLLGVGLALVALGLALTDWALSLRPGVTEANVKRIRPGMLVTDVIALLGEPPLKGSALLAAEWKGRDDMNVALVWHGADGEVFVLVDHERRVVKVAAWYPSGNARPGVLARLRAWLGW